MEGRWKAGEGQWKVVEGRGRSVEGRGRPWKSVEGQGRFGLLEVAHGRLEAGGLVLVQRPLALERRLERAHLSGGPRDDERRGGPRQDERRRAKGG